MSAAEALALAGCLALAVGTLAGLAPGAGPKALSVQAVGMTLLGAAGLTVLIDGSPVGAGFSDGIDPTLGIDRLSGYFLAMLAVVSVPVLVYSRDYLGRGSRARALVPLTGAFLATLAGFIAARDPTALLGFWELLTVVPAAAILVRSSDAAVRHAVFVYLAVTHLGGVGVWLCVLTLADHGSLSDPGAIVAQGQGLQAFVIAAGIVGFGTKAGLMPMHAWLPRAHPVAPAPLSALMSGVMIKVALYGLVRVLFEWAAPAPEWSGFVVLSIGLLSALGGVLYALVQHDLKRLLAFHSIENVGIVALALGASILFAANGSATWAGIAFAAGLLHILNHAIFKGLLFLGAGSFERSVGALDVDHLGGLLRRMPWTAGAFLVGSMAIAGVPPLNGFASEWLTLQALLHLAIEPPLGVALAGAIATAGLAATAALALYCFVKVVGLVLLGPPRTEAAARAAEAPLGMGAGMGFLAALCVVLGVAPGVLVPTLADLAPQPVELPAGAGLEIPGTGSLPSPWLALGLLAVGTLLWRLRGERRTAPAPAWACGQRVEPALNYTSAGFTKPLRLVLESILRPRREVTTIEARGQLLGVRYAGEVPHLFDTLLYSPAQKAALRVAHIARRLQSGSVRTYAAYLLGLVLLLLLLLRTGAIG